MGYTTAKSGMKQSTYRKNTNKKSGPYNAGLPWAFSQPMEGNAQGTLQDLPATNNILNLGDMFK